MPVLKYWDPALGRYAPLKGGPPGPPVEIDADAETLPAGSEATVETSGDRGQQLLSFGIPRGDKGETGAVGPTGRVDEIWSSTPPPGAHGRRWIDPSATSVAPPEGHSHNQYITEELADARYEKKLLTQAVAWYDAGNVGADRLLDLSGNGRDAVFGAGAAAPVVLPWDGEDYIAFQNQTVIEYVGVCVYVASTATTVWEFDLDTSFSVNCHVFASDAYYHGGFTYNVDLTSSIRYRGVTAVFDYRNPMRRHRLRLEYRPDGWAVHVDGEQVGSGSWTATAHGYSGNCTVGNNATSQRYNLYSAVLEQDGSATWRIDPRNVNADYTKIANTGTAGGDWVITRAASGFKAAVVDRPLVLFGGGTQYAEAASALPPLGKNPKRTVLLLERSFSDSSAGYKKALEEGKDHSGGQRVGWWLGGAYGASSDRAQAIAFNGDKVSPPPADYMDVAVVGAFGLRSHALVLNGAASYISLNGKKATGTAPSELANGGWPVRVGSGRAGGQHWCGEFLGAAIFDRALTDAEVAQASAELLGTPHYAQTDPHPQYILAPSTTVRRHGEWETAATWAALPSTGNWLGRRVKVLDGLGLCVAVWDGAKWVVDPVSDTGWCAVAWGNGWTGWLGTALEVRRMGPVCYVRGSGNGAASTSTTMNAVVLPYQWVGPSGVRTTIVGKDAADDLVAGEVIDGLIRANSKSPAVFFSSTWHTEYPWPTTPPA